MRNEQAVRSQRMLVMGIVNVTPDSFSDGGCYDTVERAVARVQTLIADGADVIDIGGESTRPGADPVDEQEELRRIVPVLEAVQALRLSVPLSLDTTKSAVAAEGIARGVTIINDVSAGQKDERMLSLVARQGVTYVSMHAQEEGRPWTLEQQLREMQQHVVRARQAGIDAEHIWIDPGFGFGKSREQNMTLLKQLSRIVALGYPVVIGTSRKRFVRQTVGVEAQQSLPATLVTTVYAHWAGVHIVRVHDVQEHRQAVCMMEAIEDGWQIDEGR